MNTTLSTSRVYPCGCNASGSGDVPSYCPTHGQPPAVDTQELQQRLNDEIGAHQFSKELLAHDKQRAEQAEADARELWAALNKVRLPLGPRHAVREKHRAKYGTGGRT